VFRNGLQILANGSRRGQSSLSVARCWSLIPLAGFSAWTPAIRSSWTRSADVSVASASKTAWLDNEQLQLYVLSSMECSDKRRQRSSCIVLAVFVALAWSAQDAAACFCPAGGACGDVTKADSVFVATVERIEPNVLNNGSAFAGRAVHLTDIRSLRGETPSSVMTGLGGGDCGYNFQPGTRYLIVAHRRPTDGRLWTSICSPTQPLAEAEGLIAYIESLNAPADGGRVWGRVRLATPGTNVPSALSGAQVTIRGPIEATTTTDSDGNYGFTRLPPGQYAVTAAEPPGRKGLIAMAPRDVSIELSHACAIVDFVARNNGRIRGRVVGQAGSPIAKLLVDLQPQPFKYGASIEHGAETDANGYYEFSEVSQGRYRVGINFALGPNSRLPYPISTARTAAGADVVEVGPAEDVELSPLVLTPLAPVTVDVLVQLEDGSPVNDVMVAADAVGTTGPFDSAQGVQTDRAGHYRMTLYRDTSYRILVRRAQKTLSTVDITGGETSLVITLAK
jgi:Carboxypeptidase regulatory-like domain